MDLAFVSQFMETHSGRDKILRTLSYMAKLLTVKTTCEVTEKNLKIFGSQMSNCRMTLRLLDDLPMLRYVTEYGWGKEESDPMIRWCQLIQNAVDMLYLPIEHVYWAACHNILSTNVNKWDNLTTYFWLASLHLSLLKTLRRIQNLRKYKTQLRENKIDRRTTAKIIRKKRCNELLTFIRLILDISYAASYLPPGILWGGRFKTWHVGALGTMSSLIGLYQVLSRRLEIKKQS